MSFALRTLLLATRNKGKLRELRTLLQEQPTEVLSLEDVSGVPDDVDETGDSFADNAALKALCYGVAARIPTLADDSGLEVDALDGAPGVYSARFAGPGASDLDNNALLLNKLAEVSDSQRTARFRCVLALYLPDADQADALAHLAISQPEVSVLSPSALKVQGAPQDAPGAVFLMQGHVEGRILRGSRGEQGFGYDPLFYHEALAQTFAEAPIAKKGVSHRAQALRILMKLLSPTTER